MTILTIVFSAITISLLVLTISLMTYTGFVSRELQKQKVSKFRDKI